MRIVPIPLKTIVEYCEQFLKHKNFPDYSGAMNGLQLSNSGSVNHIAMAVDANLLTIRKAVKTKADFLLVHHGIGWSPLCPITGNRYEWLSLAIKNNLAIYSSHLPLDAHPRYGNNVLMAKVLGLKKITPFFEEKGVMLGQKGILPMKREILQKKMAEKLGATPTLLPFGPSICKNVGIVTGGAGNHLAQAAAEGVDTFITGEGNHWTFSAAQELGINVFYGGHYLTETFGVRAFGAHLSNKYSLPSTFIDYPSGL